MRLSSAEKGEVVDGHRAEQLADEDDEESGSVVPAPMTRPTAPAAPAPQKTAKAQTQRRRKAIMALRALHRKIGD